MASLTNWLSSKSEIIELGIIKNKQEKDVYIAAIAGTEKRVYNTLTVPLSSGDRVLISKLHSGKRYIMNKTGFSGDYNDSTTTEVFIDG